MIEKTDRTKSRLPEWSRDAYREAGLRVRRVNQWPARTMIRERCEHITIDRKEA